MSELTPYDDGELSKRGLRLRCAELRSENARLRDALKNVRYMLLCQTDAWVRRSAADIIREALPELPNGTVDEFMRVLFRERSWGEMAESETYAHLEHLRESGELAKHFDGGLAHYTLVG